MLIENRDIKTAWFFIATSKEIQEVLIKHYQRFLDQHDGIRPKNHKTTQTMLTIKQTTGRIMRLREGNGLQRRVVVVRNVTDADENSIAGLTANLQSRTVQPVQVVRYSGQSVVVDACCEFVDNGKVTAEELGQIKKATKGQKTTLQHLKKFRANGMDWRESARRCGPERHFTSKKMLGIIKGIFEDNRRMTLKNINEVISGE